jgi:hypothetical protein
MGWNGVQFQAQARILLFATTSTTALDPTQPPMQWVLQAISPGIRWLAHDHSPLYHSKAKNVWSNASTHPYIFMIWCLIKHRDNFNLLLSNREL